MHKDEMKPDWDFMRDFKQNFDTSNFSFVRSFRRHGGMRYYVLWLLSQRSMRGSEIMDEVQKQTMGWWRPSPGTIYPLLSSLEKDGFLRRLEDLRYELTDEGASEIGLKREDQSSMDKDGWNIDRILSEMESDLAYLEEEKDKLVDFETKLRALSRRLSQLMEEEKKEK